MTLETLNTQNDEELRTISARCLALLEERDKERKEKAMEQAKAILAKAGLNLLDLAGRGKPVKNGKPPVYRAGRRYQHPMQTELVWNAKGQKPNWVRELEKQGRLAVELPAPEPANHNLPSRAVEPANDNAPPVMAARPRG